MAPSGWCQRFSLACRCSSQYPSSPGFLCGLAWGVLRCFAYGCAHTCCRAWGLLCFLTVLWPGSSGYSSPLGFPIFAMGSPLRGRGLFVLDRNEGVVSPFGSGPLVISWLDLKPLSAASLRALSLLVCCRMVLHMSVNFGCP